MGRALHSFVHACGVLVVVLATLWMGGCGGGATSTGGGNNGGSNGGGTGGGNTGGGTGSPNITVSVSPKTAAIAASTQAQQYTATVTEDPKNLGVTWSVDTVNGGNASVGSITNAGVYTPPAGGGSHTITATSVANTSKSASVTVIVSDLSGVLTWHNNLARDGSNTHEFALTKSSVTAATFGKLFFCAVDGVVYAQPLWIPGVSVNGTKHNAVLVATAHASVYAFDADQSPCVTLWHANLIDSAHGAPSGETSVPNEDVGGSTDIQPEIGIIGTPVISQSLNTVYAVTKSEGPSGTFHQRLHALDLSTGNEKSGSPANVSGSVTGDGYDSSGSTVTFNSRTHHQRTGLALVNGVVYATWASHGDIDPYHGWVMGYDAASLAPVTTYNLTANGSRGGVWMSGAAPAADSSNALYLSTGNGTFNHDSSSAPNSDLGDSVVKLTTASGISATDWFSPFNQSDLESADRDLGSSGVVLLPDQSSGTSHLLVTGGKEGRLYLLDRDFMGHYCDSCTSSSGDTNTIQNFSATSALFGTPAFWNNGLYVGGLSDQLLVYTFNSSTGKFETSPSSQTSNTFSFPGVTPSISSHGTSNGIVWALDTSQYGVPKNSGGPAVLHAYDATDLTAELWNSTQAASNRDRAGDAVKFAVPTVANGKVYVGTRTTVEVYGLLPQ
jgi:hypothetical protein